MRYYIHSDRLMHHGIKGQKWGVENGPPYPLDKKNYSASEKKANDGLEDYFLTAKIIKSSMNSSNAKKYLKERYYEQTDPKTGFKLKSREMTRLEDLKRVNPEYGSWNDKGTNVNCVICSLAYELRRRGYDVRAGKTNHGYNGGKEGTKLFGAEKSKWIPGQEYKQLRRYNIGKKNKTAYNDTVKELSKHKNTRGQMLVDWNTAGGHSFLYEVDSNGKVTFMDAQIGKILSDREAKKVFARTIDCEYQRLDNAKQLNIKFAKEIFR